MSKFQLTPAMRSFDDLVLNNDTKEIIDDLLEDQIYRTALLENGLEVRNKIFFHGETGCGKTSITHAIAKKLELPLYIANGAQIFQSHLGESEKSVEQIFVHIKQKRCVFLIDEADSFVSKRGDDGDAASSTQNRVVNTFLTNMDMTTPAGILVCCTNLIQNIDKAVLRRFDLQLEIPKPTKPNLRKIAEKLLDGRFGITAESILEVANTAHDVERICIDRLRAAVIAEEKRKIAEIKSQLSMSV